MYVVKTIQMHVWPVRAAKEPVQSLTAPYSLSLPTGKKDWIYRQIILPDKPGVVVWHQMKDRPCCPWDLQ